MGTTPAEALENLVDQLWETAADVVAELEGSEELEADLEPEAS
jgi:hypothetical protein